MATKKSVFWKKLVMKRNLPEESENMACEICLVKFSLFKKRKECIECHGDCCSSCVVKDQGKQTCKRCCVLMAIPPDPSALMRLKVKDLKQYLGRKHISHQGCTQKDELVELVLQVALSASRPQRPPVPPPPAHTNPVETRQNRESTSSSTPHESVQINETDHSSPSSSNCHPPPQFRASESSETEFQPAEPATSQENINKSSPPSQLLGRKPDDLLSLLESEDAVNALTVRQLMLILSRHFVDFKGCCEKAELQDRVRRLWRQHRETKDIDPDTLSNEQLCKICWELPINCVLLECGHMATCTECGKQMNQCPICRQYVVRVVHTFRA